MLVAQALWCCPRDSGDPVESLVEGDDGGWWRLLGVDSKQGVNERQRRVGDIELQCAEVASLARQLDALKSDDVAQMAGDVGTRLVIEILRAQHLDTLDQDGFGEGGRRGAGLQVSEECIRARREDWVVVGEEADDDIGIDGRHRRSCPLWAASWACSSAASSVISVSDNGRPSGGIAPKLSSTAERAGAIVTVCSST